MRWREGDRGREGAEIISRKVFTQSDSWRFEALFKVKQSYSVQKLKFFVTLFCIWMNKYTDLKMKVKLTLSRFYFEVKIPISQFLTGTGWELFSWTEVQNDYKYMISFLTKVLSSQSPLVWAKDTATQSDCCTSTSGSRLYFTCTLPSVCVAADTLQIKEALMLWCTDAVSYRCDELRSL